MWGGGSFPPSLIERVIENYTAMVVGGSVRSTPLAPLGGFMPHTHPCTPYHRKTLQVKIVDDEEYEKKDNFFIELGQPQWLKRGISGEGCWAGDGGSPPEVHLQGSEQELGRKVN